MQDKVTIPGWVDDLETFRRWIQTEEMADVSGWLSYLNGEIWIDLTMEELLTHNQVKMAYAYEIVHLLATASTGMFVADRILFTNTVADLSTEPDGLFFFWKTVQSGRLNWVKGAKGIIELSGTPEMALEVVSQSSFRKDTVRLRELYWKAGIAEYWLVDARGEQPRFEILRHSDEEYVSAPSDDGWLTSAVFERQFQLIRQTNPLGHPQFVVHVKTIEEKQ